MSQTGLPRIAMLPGEINRREMETRLARVSGIALESAAGEQQLLRLLPEADALVIATPRFSRTLQAAVAAAPRLRWLQLLNAGVEGIAPGSLPARLIISSANLALAPAVAEHALSLLLALGRRLHETIPAAARGEWNQAPKERMHTLAGSTVAIVGFGAIGQQLARRVRAFDCRVIAVTRTGEAHALADNSLPIDRLDEALAAADAVALTLPLTPATRGLVNSARLARCGRRPVLVNVSRGAIIDTAALVEALHSGQIAGAGLDVTDPEPLPANHPLWTAPNVVITPHVAAGGGYAPLAEFVAVNAGRFLRGEEPLGRISI